MKGVLSVPPFGGTICRTCRQLAVRTLPQTSTNLLPKSQLPFLMGNEMKTKTRQERTKTRHNCSTAISGYSPQDLTEIPAIRLKARLN